MHKIFVHKFRDREIEMCSIDKTRRREQLRVESFSNKASGGETMAEAGCIMASALARLAAAAGEINSGGCRWHPSHLLLSTPGPILPLLCAND